MNGRLKTNNYVNDYYLNEKGQQTIGGNITIMDVGPEVIKTYQVDNTDYYYINNTKSKLNENWEVQGIKEEKLKARVSIDIPEISGENKSIIDKINNHLLQEYIEKYDNGEFDSNRKLRVINNYIRNIDSVYNKYTKIAKKSYQDNEIDEETYKFIIDDFKEPPAKYKEILNNNLQVEINALKEIEIDVRK